MTFRDFVIAIAAATTVTLGGTPPPESPAPTAEAKAQAQGLTDRLLDVSVKLDKLGELPEYKLGEPVVIELEMRNMTTDRNFWIPRRTYLPFPDLKSVYACSPMLVTAKHAGRDVQLTERGRAIEESMKRGITQGWQGGTAWRFIEDMTHPRPVEPGGGITDRPFQAQAIANLISDMTEPGLYEFEVKFLVKVSPANNGLAEGLTTTKVVRSKTLRLFLTGYLFEFDKPPAKPRPTP